MDLSKENYWISFVEKLSLDNDLSIMIPSILEDLCHTFGFGCGFTYEGNYNNIFQLTASYKAYPTLQLSDKIDLTEAIGKDMINELSHSMSVSFHDSSKVDTELERSISDLFGAKSLMLVPVIGKNDNLTALVGLFDRRAKDTKDYVDNRRISSKYFDDDLVFVRSIISILANYIKMQMYRQQAENAQFGLEGTLDNMGIDVYVNDFDTHEILYLNRSMAAPYGTVEEMTGNICWQALYDDKTSECEFCPQKNIIDKDGNPTKVYSWDYKRPFDGSWFRVFSAAFRWVDGRMAHIVSSVDITTNKRNEELIRQLAEYDILTGLPNRYSLTQYVDEIITKTNSDDMKCYIVFFDIDGFKRVNDSMGHNAGDKLLRKIGETLQSNPLTTGRSYRYGGDEFVIVVEENPSVTIGGVIKFLTEIFSTPWDLSEGVANIGASIGISTFPSDDDKTGELIRKADQAMYVSKRRGKGETFYYNRGKIDSNSIY